MPKSLFRGLVMLLFVWQTLPSFAQSGYFYRSRTSGSWSTAGSWEWSTTVNGTYSTATTAPNNTANSIVIQNGHTITITSNVTLDETTIQSGGVLRWEENTLSINNGSGDDLTIAGVFEDARNSATLPTMSPGSMISVASNGILRVLVEKNNKDGYAGNQNGSLVNNITWQNGSVFDWAVNQIFADDAVTYFPNAAAGAIPVFRITGQPGPFPEVGTTGFISINGLLEVNKDMTLAGSGLKTLRNGIIGSASLTMKLDGDVNKTCGKLLINGATSIIGGAGSIVLNNNGLDIASAMCTLISNKTIQQNHANGTMQLLSNATLDAQTFVMSGSAKYHQQDNGHLITAHANGVTGSIQCSGSKTFGTYCHFTFDGTANQITGTLMPAMVGDINISNTGTAGSNNNVSVTNSSQQTIQGNLTILYGQFNLNLAADADLYLHGNFNRYVTATYNDNGRTTTFSGSKHTQINTPLVPPASGSNPTVQDFGVAIVNKAAGYKVILNTSTGIGKKITLINGIVDAIAYPLYIKNPAPDAATDGASGGNNGSYIDGALYRYTSVLTTGAYHFPIGKSDAGKYRPVSFTSTTVPSVGAVYKAEFFGGTNATPQGGNDEEFLNTLQGVLKDEFWQFDKTQGNEDAKGKLAIYYAFPGNGNHWRSAQNDPLDATQCSNCAVAVVKRSADNGAGNWDFTKQGYTFDVYGNPPEARPTAESGYIVSGELSSFSPFTIGFSFDYILGKTSLPVRLLGFEGAVSNNNALFNWHIEDADDVRYFELEHSNDGLAFTPVLKVLPRGERYTRIATAMGLGKHFYRLRIETVTGKSLYSKVLVLEKNNSQTMRLLQHPGASAITLAYSTLPANGKLHIQLSDILGRPVQQWTASVSGSTLLIPIAHLQAGQYVLQVISTDNQHHTFKFIR